MNRRIESLYRRARAHQLAKYGSLTTYPDGRTEYTGGGAAYGMHAIAALASARRHAAFVDRLARDVKAAKKRSRAARKAAAKRRK